MEKKLSQLFDYQRFERNAELEEIIAGVHNKTRACALSLDEAELVAAAGSKYVGEKKPDDEKLWK